MRYYFDSRDGDSLAWDQEGVECADLERARREAARGLAEFARDILPLLAARKLSISVRDEDGHEVLTASLAFDVRVMMNAGLPANGRALL